VTIIKPITATEWGTKGCYVDYIIGFGGRPGRRLTTDCVSFAPERSCKDYRLWGALIH